MPGMPSLPDNEKNTILHISLPIIGGVKLQGTDMLESMGRLPGHLPRQIRHSLDVQFHGEVIRYPSTLFATDRYGPHNCTYPHNNT